MASLKTHLFTSYAHDYDLLPWERFGENKYIMYDIGFHPISRNPPNYLFAMKLLLT